VRLAVALDGSQQEIPAHPVTLLSDLARGRLAWPRYCTLVLLGLLVIAGALAAGIVVLWRRRGRRGGRVDRAAAHMGRGRELAALERRGATGACHIVERARAQSRGHEREQHGADPAPQVPGIAVRGIVMHRQAERGDVPGQIVVREREQRAHQSAPGSGRHAGEPRGPAPPQQPEENRLDLVVAVMRGDQIARTASLLDFAQPRVPGAARGGLRGVGTESQLAQLERQVVAPRERADRLSHRPTVRLNPVIRMRHDQRETELRSEGVQQVE
jgi:hypothetical protein